MTTVRAAQAGDVSAMVAVHQEAFPGFFLTSLGSAFLTRFYAAIVTEPGCISLLAVDSRWIAGFVVGPLHPNRFFRGLLLRSGAGFVLDAAPAMARRPLHTARHLLRGLLFRGEAPEQYPDAALVSSIAVRPAAAGSGAAGALLDEFCAQAADCGRRFVYLTTDRDSNEAANRFYVKHGFTCELRLERRDGRVMNRYVRILESVDSGRVAATGVGNVQRT